MVQHTYHYELQVAIAAVRDAARLCRAVQREMTPDVIEKQDRSPVTVADLGSQAIVCRTLRDVFADDPIIAEEDATALRQDDHSEQRVQVVRRVRGVYPEADEEAVLRWIDYGNARDQSDRFWTLDPIDGTKGFLRGEQYAIALALIVDGEVEVAALACPNLLAGMDAPAAHGVVYTAIRGSGTSSLPLDRPGKGIPVHVSTLHDPVQARFCESVESGHSSHRHAAAVAEHLGLVADPIRMDSQAKYAVVARGDADIYLRLTRRPGYVERIWDHAAGSLIVTEAGGRVTDITGAPLAFRHGTTLETNRGIVVTNGPLHDSVLDALAAVGVA